MLSTIGYAFGLIRPRSEEDVMRSHYLSGARDLPRAFLRDAFSIDSEVDRAVSEMNNYAPQGKSATDLPMDRRRASVRASNRGDQTGRIA